MFKYLILLNAALALSRAEPPQYRYQRNQPQHNTPAGSLTPTLLTTADHPTGGFPPTKPAQKYGPPQAQDTYGPPQPSNKPPASTYGTPSANTNRAANTQNLDATDYFDNEEPSLAQQAVDAADESAPAEQPQSQQREQQKQQQQQLGQLEQFDIPLALLQLPLQFIPA